MAGQRIWVVILVLLALSAGVLAQTDGGSSVPSSAISSPPRVVKFGGLIPNAQGTIGVTFALYNEQSGGAPLWLETQNVMLDANGRYTVVLGANHKEGLPMALFARGEARWLGVQPDGQEELARTMLVSVPYALAASDAQTLGGKPLSAFVFAGSKNGVAEDGLNYVNTAAMTQAINAISGAAVGYLPVFTSTAGDMTSSGLFQNTNGTIGINTTNPASMFHIVSLLPGVATFQRQGGARFTFQNDTDAGGTGVIFYVTDSAATNYKALSFDASTLRFRANGSDTNVLFVDALGKVGIGTTTPGAKLDVVGDLRVSGNVIAPSATAVTFTGSSASSIVTATQNGTGVSSINSTTLAPAGVQGTASASSGVAAGSQGVNLNSPDGVGVLGVNRATTPDCTGAANPCSSAPGVYGVNYNAKNGVGVFGEAYESTNTNPDLGSPVGVYGYAKSSIGFGVGGADDSLTGLTTGVWGGVDSTDGFGIEGDAYSATGVAAGVAGFSDADQGKGVVGYARHTTGSTIGVRGNVVSPNGVAGLFENTGGGDILIGRNSLTSTNVFRVDNTGKVYGNGTFQTSGADFAESFAVRGTKAEYQPGDLLAIDETGNRRLALAQGPYSTLVAGIYSTKPGLLATPHSIESRDPVEKEVPLAVVGIVPCKVTAENGAIQRGDLLVASSKAGYAMKGTDRSKMVGAVVGKALENLPSGEGVIQVLVTLQ